MVLYVETDDVRLVRGTSIRSPRKVGRAAGDGMAGVEVTDAGLVLEGLKVLAAGFGLNSIALTFNLPDVEVAGLRNPADR